MHISQLLHEDHDNSSFGDFLQQSENEAIVLRMSRKWTFWRRDGFIRGMEL